MQTSRPNLTTQLRDGALEHVVVVAGKPVQAHSTLKAAMCALALAMALSGCSLMPRSAVVELSHDSHATAGKPFGPANEEDALTRASLLLKWKYNGVTILAGEGINLDPSSGFYGPREVFTARASYEMNFGGAL